MRVVQLAQGVLLQDPLLVNPVVGCLGNPTLCSDFICCKNALFMFTPLRPYSHSVIVPSAVVTLIHLLYLVQNLPGKVWDLLSQAFAKFCKADVFQKLLLHYV